MGLIARLLLLGLLLCVAVPAGAVEKIVIAGTGDSLRLLGTLGRAFERLHPAAEIVVPPSVGSTGGIKRLLAGDCRLARVARPLEEQERKQGLEYRVFAFSPVVFVANLPAPCLEGLTSSQVIEIFAGRLTAWSQLSRSCERHKIYVANREEGDSSRRIIEQRLPAFGAIASFAGEVLYSTQENLQTLERHPYTIGYLPLASARHSSLAQLALDGLLPDTLAEGDPAYPLMVPLGIVWKDEPQGAARQFVDFLFSPEARALIRANGGIPAQPGT